MCLIIFQFIAFVNFNDDVYFWKNMSVFIYNLLNNYCQHYKYYVMKNLYKMVLDNIIYLKENVYAV